MTDISWWRAVRAAGGQVPPERPLAVLLSELEEMLGNPDTTVRDDIGFQLLGSWIVGGVFDDDLPAIGHRMSKALQAGVGGHGDDTVFKRSYSALILGLIVERDNTFLSVAGEHALEPQDIHFFSESLLRWWGAERDLRGAVDSKRGVAHAIAHGADLIAALARNSYVDTELALTLLNAIIVRIEESSGVTFLLSEEERLAYAVMSLLHRADITPADLYKAIQPLYALAALRNRTDLDPRAHARLNALNWLRALYLQLDIGVKGMPWYAQDGHFDGAPRSVEVLREIVREALLEYSHWFVD